MKCFSLTNKLLFAAFIFCAFVIFSILLDQVLHLLSSNDICTDTESYLAKLMKELSPILKKGVINFCLFYTALYLFSSVALAAFKNFKFKQSPYRQIYSSIALSGTLTIILAILSRLPGLMIMCDSITPYVLHILRPHPLLTCAALAGLLVFTALHIYKFTKQLER